MKVIADVGNKQYYALRAIEEIQNYGATSFAIQLLALGVAARDNEEVHS